MAKLSRKRRKSLNKNKFALPESRKYPVDTKARAANAKARAAQQVKKGNLSKSSQQRVNRKANAVLNRRKKSGGRKKKR